MLKKQVASIDKIEYIESPLNINIWVHLKKSFLKKNMCLADTSVRGKKWQMALFQVGSYIANLK